ncbi:MAG TPA: ABC transporter substrate-binding protein [Burkholderiales bacterium]|nr:ABC transporter substrate-binding protein [Burkholderiales bacterium]
MNRRRKILVALAIGGVGAPLLAQQPAARVLRIGYVDTSSAHIANVRLDRLRAGLRDLGYVEGKNIVIEARWAETRYERLPALVAELLAQRLDVMVAAGPAAIQAVRQATTSLPVVMAASGDPLVFGFVQTLSRPGGNITGLSSANVDVSYKYVEILREAVPSLSAVAVLVNPGHPGHPDYLRSIQAAAQQTVRVLPIQAATAGEIDAAFSVIEQTRAGALVVLGDGLFFAQSSRIAELAARQHLPTLFSSREPVQVGGLMSYGPNLAEQFYRAATYVDKILKGANPGDLPVEQPTTFELAINLKTAKAIGLTIGKELLLRADVLIE